MKLLLDQNISRKLLKDLQTTFSGSEHVFNLNLQSATDKEIWEYARDHKFTIITQDSDFNERGVIYGYPPKIIWLRTGNVSTSHLRQVFKQHTQEIRIFGQDKTLGCLQIFNWYKNLLQTQNSRPSPRPRHPRPPPSYSQAPRYYLQTLGSIAKSGVMVPLDFL